MGSQQTKIQLCFIAQHSQIWASACPFPADCMQAGRFGNDAQRILSCHCHCHTAGCGTQELEHPFPADRMCPHPRLALTLGPHLRVHQRQSRSADCGMLSHEVVVTMHPRLCDDKPSGDACNANQLRANRCAVSVACRAWCHDTGGTTLHCEQAPETGMRDYGPRPTWVTICM